MKLKNILMVVICLMLFPQLSQAEDWTPKGSIKLQIGFGAGGTTDIIGRLIAAQVEEDTNWNIVVENKPGGGGVAMLSGLMNQKPDGMKLGVCVNIPILLNLALRGDKLPFNLESFDYIGTILRGENALVVKSDAPFNDIEGLIAYAKTNSVAIGFDAKPQQMLMDAVAKQAHVKFKFVKHKSGGEQIQSLLGGHITAGILAGAHIKYLKSGDLKMIASVNKNRHSYEPEKMTLIENGYDFYLDPYYYIVAPKGLPGNVKSTLAKAFNNAIYSKKIIKALYNILKVGPNNLGTDGTLPMLMEGQKDIKVLINAGK